MANLADLAFISLLYFLVWKTNEIVETAINVVIIHIIVIFNSFYQLIKSLSLVMKCVSKHEYL